MFDIFFFDGQRQSIHRGTKLTKTPISILDLAQIVEGNDVSQSFRNSVAIANHAEQLGYKRIWFAEHHSMPGVASSATSVLIAHVAAHTRHIRVGSGGIMLPNHSPLVVAEQFGTLDSLHPGRIDLGLGRAPGGDGAVIRALRRQVSHSENSYPSDVDELVGYLSKTNIGDNVSVRAVPGEGSEVPVYILGTSLFSARFAASRGLPYAFGSHFAPSALIDAVDIYRREFKPSVHLKKPYFMMACNVFAAETNEEAQYHFSSLIQLVIKLLTNNMGPVPLPVEDLEIPPYLAPQIENMLQVSAIGSLDNIIKALTPIIKRLRPDELIVAKNFHNHEARMKSLELTIEAWERLHKMSQAA